MRLTSWLAAQHKGLLPSDAKVNASALRSNNKITASVLPVHSLEKTVSSNKDTFSCLLHLPWINLIDWIEHNHIVSWILIKWVIYFVWSDIFLSLWRWAEVIIFWWWFTYEISWDWGPLWTHLQKQRDEVEWCHPVQGPKGPRRRPEEVSMPQLIPPARRNAEGRSHACLSYLQHELPIITWRCSLHWTKQEIILCILMLKDSTMHLPRNAHEKDNNNCLNQLENQI